MCCASISRICLWLHFSFATVLDPDWLVCSVLCAIDSSQQANIAGLWVLFVKGNKKEIRLYSTWFHIILKSVQRFSRTGPRGRAREEVCGTLTKGTFSSRLLRSNQDKGCTPSVAHSLPLPPGFCSTCQVIQAS